MPRQVYEYDPPERFVAGTTGQPGGRTFFLQARVGTRLTTVQLEKEQVSVLAERVDELLDEVLRRTAGSVAVPALAPVAAEDTAPLDIPIEEEFKVGTMSLAWDGEQERVVIECFELGESTPEDEDELPDTDAEADGAVLRVSLAGAAARAFAKRALALVSAGRPPCPFCSNPLDPEGHICPRANGYRR
jgi:uncharacterized repeat protein (TIGR03847 family)